jgi:membrane-bound metal-dependent hydrolase YbcI (DUF457 family)
MNKIGHLAVGILLGTILILLTHYYLNWFDFKSLVNIGFLIGIIYIYSLLPDVDMKNSAVTWTFIPMGLIAAIAGYVMNNQIYLLGGIALIAVTFIAAQFFPHRGFTHSILFGIAVSLPWIYLSYEYAILAFVCYYSHLMADKEFFKLV